MGVRNMIVIRCNNIDGFFRKRGEIKKMLSDEKIDILGLSETHITDKTNDGELNIIGYKMYRVNSHSSHTGGLLIYVNENLKIEEGWEYINEEIWAKNVMLKFGNKRVCLILLYRSPSGSEKNFLEWLKEVIIEKILVSIKMG